jgi:hypothetical protein
MLSPLLFFAAVAFAAPENPRFTSCPSALAYLDDRSEAGQEALSKEFWSQIEKDAVLREYTLALLRESKRDPASAPKMRDFFCLTSTVLANINHNLASGKWTRGGWGENAKTNESAKMSDPHNVADNPRVTQQKVEELGKKLLAMQEALKASPGNTVRYQGGDWDRKKLQESYRLLSNEHKDYSEALQRTYGLCRHWANDNATAMSEVPQKSYKVGVLSVYHPYSWQAMFGEAAASEHNVAQVCQADCKGPCFVIDAWGGTRILDRAKFMSGYKKMNEGVKLCD